MSLIMQWRAYAHREYTQRTSLRKQQFSLAPLMGVWHSHPTVSSSKLGVNMRAEPCLKQLWRPA